ncbi:MAG TPA: 3-keto-5-aminohexanoate cleavage protein [Acidimicrobiales bacterium]|nr:3-keto-5-aminohexanoate cleavage protein [Actinomycetes bacterium]MDP6105514.1 3-keto-5-aminohexanoate cleavage protein [Acidimicrobiales bacterium]MCP4844739.1 3-keto-5-aminohexanoate cleavage protein [Actinomycetes bacterium]MDP6239738.1 3-keto-5-aminohexanoate cleavage protein [Acidimicrobiales bacterium]MDP7124436.1 3-keto-5-aminohexanoate cleavage protein [Acidimicrobiales bacterium]
MNRNVIISCAVTGAGDTAGRSEHVPVTPQQIAEAALDAARAGAAIVHCHVRDPETGKGTRTVAYYREVVERIREQDDEVVINLTAGMGGDLVVGPDDDPMAWQDGTDMVGGIERLAHVEAIRPDICSMDCGSLNFGNHNEVYVSTPDMLRIMAERVRELGVRPELEIFDTGNFWFAETMISEGLIDAPYWFQLCLSIPYGTPLDIGLLIAMVNRLPAEAEFTSFALGAMQMPMVAQSVMLGGHVRVGLEDNLYLERGVLATNAQLVEKAVKIVELMGASVQTPIDARKTLGLG